MPTSLKAQRAEILRQARSVAEAAKSAGRDLTADERTKIDDALSKADALSLQIDRETEAAATWQAIENLGPVGAERNGPIRKGYVSLDGAKIAKSVVTTASGGQSNIKALVSGGVSAAGTPMVTTSPVEQGRPATGLLSVLPAIQVPSEDFSYLRQNARDLKAAPVAKGALKPTSTLGIEKITDRLRVVAHVTDALDEYMLRDAALLSQFVADELVFGLRTALESQLIAGTGTGENLKGLTKITGTTAQAFDTNAAITLRRGIGALEGAGYEAAAIVLHPSDWTALEVAMTSNGGFVLGSGPVGAPLDAVKRTLWGVPVAVSVGVPAGTGIVLAKDAVTVFTDVYGLQIAWAAPGDSFQHNQVVARCEGRFGLAVNRPAGVVLAKLASA